MRRIVWCAFVVLLFAAILTAEYGMFPRSSGVEGAPIPVGEARAGAIASSSSRIKSLYAQLEAEIRRVADAGKRRDGQALLKRPVFMAVRGRKSKEGEIVQALKANGLLASDVTSLFPGKEPMPFIAAPGGTCDTHHSYPGGLVDHSLSNIQDGLALASTWERRNQKTKANPSALRLDADLIRLTALWHDVAKTMTIEWNNDGSCTRDPESKIAKTGAHHVWGVSEALFRGYPPDFVVALASAHNPPIKGDGLEELVNYLKAAALISGKRYEAAGLARDGTALTTKPPLEAFINNLDDHSWVMHDRTYPESAEALREQLRKKGIPEEEVRWEAHKIMADRGDLPIWQELRKQGK